MGKRHYRSEESKQKSLANLVLGRTTKHPAGYKLSEETKLKMSKSSMGNPGFTGKHTEESKKKMSEKRKGHPYYGPPKDPESAYKKISKSNTGKKRSLEAKAKYSKAAVIRNASNMHTVSNPELHIKSYLMRYGFEFKSQYVIILGEFHHSYDFLIKLPNGIKLLMEYDGEYWHSSKNPKWSLEKDLKRETVAKELGYQFCVIKSSGYDKDNLKYVKSKIAKFYPEFADMHLSDRVNN